MIATEIGDLNYYDPGQNGLRDSMPLRVENVNEMEGVSMIIYDILE